MTFPGPFDDDGHLVVVVESPRGSTTKLKYCPSSGVFESHRYLVRGLTFPFDFGFVPGTKADDGDPIDALVIHDAATYPGVIVRSEILGILKLAQNTDGKRVRNDRLVVVPAGRRDQCPKLDHELRLRLEEFARASTADTDKDVQVLGWGDADEAEEAVENAATPDQNAMAKVG